MAILTAAQKAAAAKKLADKKAADKAKASPNKAANKAANKANKLDNSLTNGLPLQKYKGDLTFDKITGQQISDPTLVNTDTNFDVQKVTPGTVTSEDVQAGSLANQFLTAADYTMVDPSQIASEFGDINRGEIKKNSDLASSLALDTIDTELKGLQNFAPAASTLKRNEINADNKFNQQQRDEQLAAGDPNYRSDLEGQASRARSFANGGVPDSIGDKALELGIRSRAADSANSGGFGVGSSAAKKAASLMSAEQRIGLSQYGDQLLTSNLGTRASTLLAPTQYSDAGAQIKVTPTVSAGQIQSQISSEANAGNITARDALSTQVNQEQFKTNLEQDTGKTNVTLAADRDLNQAQLDLQADTGNADRSLQAQSTNVGNTLQADLANAGNSLSAQQTAASIKSSEGQFNSQLKFNTENSNADRAFQADNINAGRALEVADKNRTMRATMEANNKNMVYQDKVRREAQAAASAAAARSAAASRSNAAMNYSLQQQRIAAGLQAANIDAETKRQQSAAAADAFKEGRDRAQTNDILKTGASVIMQAPKIIDGVKKVMDLIPSFSSGDDDSGGSEGGPAFSLDRGDSSNDSVSSGSDTPAFSLDTGSDSGSKYTLY